MATPAYQSSLAASHQCQWWNKYHHHFYNKLTFLYQHIPKYNILIFFGGDMNSCINKDGNNKFCLHGWGISIETKHSKKEKKKLWTYTDPNNFLILYIYIYIYINKKLRKSTLKCGEKSSFEEISFDHRCQQRFM